MKVEELKSKITIKKWIDVNNLASFSHVFHMQNNDESVNLFSFSHFHALYYYYYIKL
jgi:hypothetical protein